MPTEKTLKKKGRGAFCQVVCNDNKISIVKWFDNKEVVLASSYVDAHPVEKIKRFSKDVDRRIDVNCPQIVKHNHHMGGVNLADMLIALYRTGIKSKRWYKNIFSQLLDICINNAWFLRSRHDKQRAFIRKNDHLKSFRYEIYASLLKRDRTLKNAVSVPEKAKIKTPHVERPGADIRYDRVDHWPLITEYKRCKYCKKRQTNVVCTKCNLNLCFVKNRNCFVDFHTLP